jgi:hypothetical protein
MVLMFGKRYSFSLSGAKVGISFARKNRDTPFKQKFHLKCATLHGKSSSSKDFA